MNESEFKESVTAPQILMRVTRDYIKELKELGQTQVACQMDGYKIIVEKIADDPKDSQ